MKRLSLLVLVGLVITLSYFVWAETITLTTYYPAPYGVYKEFKTTSNTYLATDSGSVGIGTTSPQTKLDVNGAISGFGIVPIGSIMAWHKLFTNTPALPDGWVECNGQVLSDADSVYNGQTIPDLNGDARFLRGSGTSGTLQADEFKSHSHIIRLVHNPGPWPCGAHFPLYTDNYDGTPAVDQSGIIRSSGGSETRPINMSVVWVMRVK